MVLVASALAASPATGSPDPAALAAHARDVARPLLKRRHRALLAWDRICRTPRRKSGMRPGSPRRSCDMRRNSLRRCSRKSAHARIAARSTTLQEELGAWNDAAVAARLAGELAGATSRSRGCLQRMGRGPGPCAKRRARQRLGRVRARRAVLDARLAISGQRFAKERQSMLESAEVGHTIAKANYEREEARLREALLDGQFEIGEARRGPDPRRHQRAGRRGSWRDGEQAERMDGPQVHPHARVRSRRAGGGSAAAGLALLASAAPARANRDLHERVVPPAGQRARAARGERRPVRRPPPGGAAIRADAHRRGHRPAQVLDPPVARRPEAAGCTSSNPIPRRGGG